MSNADPFLPETADEEWEEFVVPEDRSGDRLDRVLVGLIPGMGRKLAARLCDERHVLQNGFPAKKSTLLTGGTRLQVRISAWGEAQPAPDVPLDIRLEREDLVVAFKPAGLPTSAVVGRETQTLAGALLARYPEMRDIGYSRREPGVLHRLDHFTSGLVVAARSQPAFEKLRAALSSGSWKKTYLALVAPGIVESEGTILAALIPDTRSRKRVAVTNANAGQGRPSRTDYKLLRSSSTCDLVEISVGKAYRHQIRAHFASIGAPLLGDELYGGPTTRLSPRHALHASYIAWAEGSDAFEVEAPLPADLSSLLEE